LKAKENGDGFVGFPKTAQNVFENASNDTFRNGYNRHAWDMRDDISNSIPFFPMSKTNDLSI
jgi:hypothetical protein